MENVQLIEGKNAVLVPIKKWERVQSELVRLRKKINKEKILSEIRNSLRDLERDLRDPNYDPANEMSADEFLAELRNEQ